MSLSREEEIRLEVLTKVINELVCKKFPNVPGERIKEVLQEELSLVIENPDVDILVVIGKISSRLNN